MRPSARPGSSSSTIRRSSGKLLADALQHEPDIEVVGLAADPFVARDLILQHKPDVITLDIEMPRMDGLTFLRKLMEHHPLPVIIVSSLTQTGRPRASRRWRPAPSTSSPKPGGPYSVGEIAEKLKQRIRGMRTGSSRALLALRARRAGPLPAPRRQLSHANGLIVIGASTGGTQAIESAADAPAGRLPADPDRAAHAGALHAGVRRSARLASARCTSSRPTDGEPLKRGVAYIAPGDYHMLVERAASSCGSSSAPGPHVHYQRPAVDVLFQSVARLRGVPIVALLLTGMGPTAPTAWWRCGRPAPSTIAEAEQSCVVFGMPEEAIARGGAMHVATLLAMPRLIAESFASRRAAARAAADPSDPASPSTSRARREV